jgi:hypothetical protein
MGVKQLLLGVKERWHEGIPCMSSCAVPFKKLCLSYFNKN